MGSCASSHKNAYSATRPPRLIGSCASNHKNADSVTKTLRLIGSCASSHKNANSATKTPRLIGYKTIADVLIESPIKENSANGEYPTAQTSFKSQSSPVPQDLCSKEEVFFDSQACLESDCEDFYSVNGDFTPSRGNTPVHHCSFNETRRLDRSIDLDKTRGSIPRPSQNNKKTLFELFRESFSGDPVDGNMSFRSTESVMAHRRSAEARPNTFHLHPKSANGSPYASFENSVCSSEKTPTTVTKSSQSMQGCLPGFVRSLSFGDRKKRLSRSYSSVR